MRHAMESHLRTLRDVIPHQFLKQQKKQEADMKPTGSGEHSSTVQEKEVNSTNMPLEHGSVSLANQVKDLSCDNTTGDISSNSPENCHDHGSINTVTGVPNGFEGLEKAEAQRKDVTKDNSGSDSAAVPPPPNIPRPLTINVNTPHVASIEAQAPPSSRISTIGEPGVNVHGVTPSPRTLETRRKVAETFDSFWPGGEV